LPGRLVRSAFAWLWEPTDAGVLTSGCLKLHSRTERQMKIMIAAALIIASTSASIGPVGDDDGQASNSLRCAGRWRSHLPSG
jgi:hypothetical protein